MNCQPPTKGNPIPAKESYLDLGNYHRAITTENADAHAWFNRGLLWCYGFNHEEAAYCFEQALLHDSTCSMAYWGLAYALGPNYNKPWDFFDTKELRSTVARTYDAVLMAEDYVKGASEVEIALSKAIVARYPKSEPEEDLSIWNQSYADAMRKVYRQFPDDLDVATLAADALMNLKPWQLWDIKTSQPSADAPTKEVQAILDQALELNGGLQHPGLLHLYIHFWEMSPHPERALPVADRLRGLVPDAGHLQHMPSHLDVLCGDYRRAIASNLDASRADERFMNIRGALNFYTLYRCHDYHFGVYAAMLAGQSQTALEIVAKLEQTLPERLLRVSSPPMADWLESFLSMRMHVLIRFGKWHDILKLAVPHDTELYCVTTAMTSYAKGVASAAIGEIDTANKYRAQLKTAITRVPESRTLFNNKSVDILAIAEAMLDGEIEYRKDNFDAAFNHLRTAIRLDDTLPYDEPWGWMQPTRHAYGALLLEQGKVEEASEAYAADLGFNDTLPRQLQHLNNVWALHGLHECLVRLGRTSEARVLQPQLKLALAFADVEIKASCFCRLETR
jgi:tetratricopeptide (TPR) repeat protein